MTHLHNITTLPMETHADLVMHSNVALCSCKQRYWHELVKQTSTGILSFFAFWWALVDCQVFERTKQIVTYFFFKLGAFIFLYAYKRASILGRQPRINSYKNDLFLYAYKNIQVYTNFGRHPF